MNISSPPDVSAEPPGAPQGGVEGQSPRWDFFDQSESSVYYVPWLWFWLTLGMMLAMCTWALPSRPYWCGSHPEQQWRDRCSAGFVMFEPARVPD